MGLGSGSGGFQWVGEVVEVGFSGLDSGSRVVTEGGESHAESDFTRVNEQTPRVTTTGATCQKRVSFL